jgi:ribosomal protein L37E
MDTKPTISDPTQLLTPANGTTAVCWCGQDIVHVEASHCPRCGTARTRRTVSVVYRLAA